MVTGAVHNTVVAILLRAWKKRWHSQSSILLWHFHCLTNDDENEEHVENLVLILVSISMAIVGVVCEVDTLTIVAVTTESHVKTFFVL